jgi:hypothetical protein
MTMCGKSPIDFIDERSIFLLDFLDAGGIDRAVHLEKCM